MDDETLAAVTALAEALDDGLADKLCEHITAAEIDALRLRARKLTGNPVMPLPDLRRPIPWPAF
jgi:hypothetical protein